MVDDPLGVLVEEGRRRMDVNGCTFDESLVSLLRVLFGRVSEEPGTDGTTDLVVVSTARDDVLLVPIHDPEELFSNILSSTHGSALDVVLETIGVGEFGGLPSVVDRQEREKIGRE